MHLREDQFQSSIIRELHKAVLPPEAETCDGILIMEGIWVLDSVVLLTEHGDVVQELPSQGLQVLSDGTRHGGWDRLLLFAQEVTQIVKGLIVVP